MRETKLNKLIYAVDALLGLILVLISFFNVFRQGTVVGVDALGNDIMEYTWMNFFKYCNFEVSGIQGVFMYAPLVLVLICVAVLIYLIVNPQLKKFDNLVVILMFIGVVIMAAIQSFGYSYRFVIVAWIVAALLLASLLPLFVLDSKIEAAKNKEGEVVTKTVTTTTTTQVTTTQTGTEKK